MATRKQKVHKLTQEQYAQEARNFGFIAVCHFWRHLTNNTPNDSDLRLRGRQYIERVASMIAAECEGQPIGPHMAEALQYAGLYVQKEWLQ